MNIYCNKNIIEVPVNDTNHCRQCKERLGKRYIIESSRFYCNIDCLSRYLSFVIKCDSSKDFVNDRLVNVLYIIIGIVLLLLIIKSF